jgi:hypothetical protein
VAGSSNPDSLRAVPRRRQKTEDRRQRTEDRGQKTENRRQKTEDREKDNRKSGCGISGIRRTGL